jgi:hypothetical protein
VKRSWRGRSSRERVKAARRQAALALGRDPDLRDSFLDPRKLSPLIPPTSESESAPVAGRGIRVLSVGEAATRLGMSRAQLEAMIARGGVETLPIEFGCVIPTREVERLQHG